ncbi:MULTISPECIES: hypothetical protein [Antarcticibacterium]|uniref:hypothetical protein n=1 Tax=Antarcticibacterium TaxID=2058174 RepID=UPI00143DC365|nr:MULTISPECIES: hypothetical protein [Antarcticibacterium]
MKKFYKIQSRIMLIMFIILASILPVPLIFYSRDKSGKFVEESDKEESKEVLEIK